MVGAYVEYVAGFGIRVELFGWLPSVATTEPGSAIAGLERSMVNPFNYIFGFRIVAEAGMHVGIGVAIKGRQVTTNSGLTLATYYITPSTIQAGRKYTGADADHPLLEGVVTAPQRDEAPSKIFKKGSTTLGSGCRSRTPP